MTEGRDEDDGAAYVGKNQTLLNLYVMMYIIEMLFFMEKTGGRLDGDFLLLHPNKGS